MLVESFAIPSFGFTFIPNEGTKTVTTSIELPQSTSLEKTNEISVKVEEIFEIKPR